MCLICTSIGLAMTTPPLIMLFNRRKTRRKLQKLVGGGELHRYVINWKRSHSAIVDKLISDAKKELPPEVPFIENPELWTGENWKWFQNIEQHKNT